MNRFFPFYHIVSDEPAPHIEQLYPVCSVDRFRADLDWFLQYFTAVGLDEITSDRKWSKPVFHLSFDDGLRQCYDTILPILLEKGVPATFFINPAFVDNRALMFRYKAGLLAGHLPGQRGRLLSIRYQNRKELDQIAYESGFDFDQFLLEYQPYMTTSQINELVGKGFTVGAHSLDHPLYSELPLAEQLHQTHNGVEFVQQHWPGQPAAFAFPFTDYGVGDAFFENRPSGLITFGCAGVKKDVQPNHFQRFAMEKHSFGAPSVVGGAYLLYLARKMMRQEYARR